MFGRLLRSALPARRATDPTLPGGADRRVDRRVERLLVETLADIPRLRSADDRLALLQETDPRLRDAVGEHRVTRDHLRAIVRTARRTNTLESLRDALLIAEPDDIGTEWFDLLVTVVTAPSGPLPARYLTGLVGELRERPQGFGRGAVFRYLAERQDAGLPLENGTVARVLLQLYDAPRPAARPDDRRVQLLRFLGLLTQDPEAGPKLLKTLSCVTQPEALTPPPAETSAERQVIVQVRVEEEGPPSDLPYTRRMYSLRGFYYERHGRGRLVYRGSRALPGLFSGAEIDLYGPAFLADWQEWAQAGRGVSKRVEFLLPHSLLGHPTEAWTGSADVRLGHTCQVVVRSLTRYKDSTVYDEWLRRWQALDRGCHPGDALRRIGWMGPDTTGEGTDGTKPWVCPGSRYPSLRLTRAAQVADWLRDHADLSCLGLGTPYDHDDALIRDAVRDALLWDGVPVMVWRRDAGDPGTLLDVLRDGAPPALLAQLPHSVHEARKRAPRDDLGSVHHQITLLWDDPTCVSTGQDEQMPGTRGAGEGAA
ncbi:hypothetical protein ACHBTE_22260 [Streptomyces sp. M41]|uniref:VMAP-C domain-containing protein n=1 Tax=Streptomyces sp. M41 TaxID=3059412 RepID=UPI00374D24BD